MDALTTAAFVIAAGAIAYLVYLAATKGVPATFAKIKSWWNAGKAEITSLESKFNSDIANLKSRVVALETATGIAGATKTAAAPAPSTTAAAQNSAAAAAPAA
jgi:hypothetical protein